MHTKPARDLTRADRVIIGAAFGAPSRQVASPLAIGTHVLLYVAGLDYPIAVPPAEEMTVADLGDFDEEEELTDDLR